GTNWIRLAYLLDAESAGPDGFSAVDERQTNAWRVEHFHAARHEIPQNGEAFLVQRVCFFPGERLTRVPFRPETLQNESQRSPALFKCRLGPIDDDDGPPVSGSRRIGRDHGTFVRRRLVLEDSPLFPSFSRRLRQRDLEGPLETGHIGSPCGSDG